MRLAIEIVFAVLLFGGGALLVLCFVPGDPWRNQAIYWGVNAIMALSREIGRDRV